MSTRTTGSGASAPDPSPAVERGPSDDHPFSATGAADITLTTRRIGPMVIADMAGGPVQLRDRPLPTGETLVCVQTVVSGQIAYQPAAGPAEELPAASLIIRRVNPLALLSAAQPCRVVSIVLSEHLLAPRLLPRAVLQGTVLAPDRYRPFSASLLQTFIVGLCEREGEPQSSSVIIDALGALIAMAVADGRPLTGPESHLPTRRLAELLNYVRENSANPALSPALAASHLKMSLRYLHKLMNLTGRSFGAEVTRLRLEFCRTALTRGNYKTIAEVAITAGFNDLSQFNRQFRSAFGVTPSEARRQDRAQPGSASDHTMMRLGALQERTPAP